MFKYPLQLQTSNARKERTLWHKITFTVLLNFRSDDSKEIIEWSPLSFFKRSSL